MSVIEPRGGGTSDTGTGTGARGFLGDAGKAAIPLLVSAGAFLTFVAVVGGAIVWFRFYAMGIPAEQAADALPRSELVVIGTVPLVLFGLLGALAVIAAYMLDRGGRATRRTFYGLVGLFVAECLVVIFLARYEASAGQENDAVVLIVGAAALAIWIAHFFQERDEPKAPALEGEPANERPDRFRHTFAGRLLLLGVVAALVGCLWRVQPEWAAVAIGVAALVALALYRLAWATTTRFAWFGVAIFLSVPIFGAAVYAAHLWYVPTAQPVAAIRSVNGTLSAFEGVYVTETDDRLVLASVATVGCGKDNNGLRRGSGRIYRVRSAELIAMELGPLQPLVGAAERARAMRLRLSRKALVQGQPSEDKKDAKSQQQSLPPAKRGVLLATRALRREPEIDDPLPPEVKPGGSFELTGSGFGERRGAVVVGRSRAYVRNGDWRNKRIEARLPKGARSGVLDVICPESRILRVLREPVAVARAEPIEGRGSYRLDASGSRDRDGVIERRSWTHNGKPVQKPSSVPIAVRPRVHRIILTVVDDERLKATDSLTLVRLPATRLFCFDCRTLSPEGEAAVGRLRKLVEAASFVRVDGHTDFVGKEAYNDELSRDRACAVAREFAGPRRMSRRRFEVRAYGESRPIDLGTGAAARARNRRVDILIDDTRTRLGPAGGRRVRCGSGNRAT